MFIQLCEKHNNPFYTSYNLYYIMKSNRILIKIILFISLILFIAEPINLTLTQMAHVPENTSVNLSAPYD